MHSTFEHACMGLMVYIYTAWMLNKIICTACSCEIRKVISMHKKWLCLYLEPLLGVLTVSRCVWLLVCTIVSQESMFPNVKIIFQFCITYSSKNFMSTGMGSTGYIFTKKQRLPNYTEPLEWSSDLVKVRSFQTSYLPVIHTLPENELIRLIWFVTFVDPYSKQKNLQWQTPNVATIQSQTGPWLL